MSKKEQLEKETKLHELETTILSNFSFNNGSLFKAAESLLVVKKNNLFKAVKNEGKMAYRTFKAYLDHFELDASHRKLLDKLIDFHEFLIEGKHEAIVPQLSSNDDFWTLFMKIKPENWSDTIKIISKYRGEIRIEDIENVLKDNPSYKIGYCAERKLPTPVQNILANSKKLDDSADAEFSLRITNDDEEGFDKLLKAMQTVSDAMNKTTTVAISNELISENNNFAISNIDNKPTAVRLARKRQVTSMSMAGTVAIIMVAGYAILRIVEFFISKLF